MNGSSDRSMRRVAALVAALSLVSAMPTSAAHASPSAADMETVRALRKEGKRLRAAKDFAGALEKFKAAYALYPTPVTGLDLAQSLVDVKQLVEARAKALDVVAMAVEADETDASRHAREEAKALANELAPRIPTLRVHLVDAPVGARVTIDGEAVPAEALAVGRRVNPGKHVAVARAEDGREPRAEIELAEGEDRTLTIAFAPVLPPKPVEPTVAVPPPPPTPPAKITPRAVAPIEPHASTSTFTWVGLGIAAPAALVGTITGIVALSTASDVKSQCNGTTCPTRLASKASSGVTVANVSTGSFVVAAAGLGLLIYGLATGGDDGPQKAAVRADVGLGWVGISGRF
jgi:hypothetical protein